MEQVSGPPTLKFGPFIVDLVAGEVRKNGSRIRVQEKPLRVLVLLAERQGQVVTRAELKQDLWPEHTFVDFETGLNTAVSKLRDALSDKADSPRYIETIPRRGYRFLAPVEFQGRRAATPAPPAAPAATPHKNQTSPQAAPSPTSAAPASEAKSDAPKPPPRTAVPNAKAPAITTIWISLAAAVAIIAGGAYWLTHGRPALSFHSRDSVLLADFENQTGDPRFDSALATAFTVSIEQSRYANVFPRMEVDAVLKRMGRPQNERVTPTLAREICQRENVRALIASSITRTGQEYALTAQLIDPKTGDTVRAYTERSYGEDHILEALDVLSRDLREALGESLYQIQRTDKPLPQVTTKSLSALQQYADGSNLWRLGKFQDATTLFKAAIASDPEFAMAHAALGGADYSYIYNAPEEGQAEYEKALSLISRTTTRERMMIETKYAMDRGHVNEADQLFLLYLNSYPDDTTMRVNYATLLRKNGRNQEAIEQLQQVLQLAPDYAGAYIGIATANKGLANYPAALQAYAKAFEIEPNWLTAGNINREYGFALVANGEDQKAEQVFTALLAKPDTRENGLRSLAFLDLYHGRYSSAQSRLEHSLEILKTQNSPLSVARVHLVLSIVAEGKGDTKAQRHHLDAAVAGLNEIQSKVVFGAMIGDACARAGFTDLAEKIAALITPLADPHSSEQSGYLHLLQGDMALAAGQNDKAIELLQQSDKENSTGLSQEALAHAYQQAGQIDQALGSYQKMISTTGPALSWEPQQRWLVARYTLASDYSSRGDNQKARDTLAALLNLWKNADPDLPTLVAAKSAYAKLQ
jgi:DNA-binding winged helix-turn-helix (wHTH) protein/tetratricopeptide (TPR) repeat protein